MADVSTLLSTLVWPLITAFVVWKLLPTISDLLAKSSKITVSVAGQEVTIEQATEQQQKLIEDVESKILELRRECRTQEFKPAATTALAAHKFSGDDLGLQNSRIALAESIEKLFESGIGEHTLETIQALTIAQHNGAWKYRISASCIPQHKEEAEILYNRLMDKLLSLESNRHQGEIASALGIMKNNMLGRIDTLRTTDNA